MYLTTLIVKNDYRIYSLMTDSDELCMILISFIRKYPELEELIDVDQLFIDTTKGKSNSEAIVQVQEFVHEKVSGFTDWLHSIYNAIRGRPTVRGEWVRVAPITCG